MALTTQIALDKFTSFGELLKYLRRRADLSQRDLSIAVGYSEGQISRLEQNKRLPDLAPILTMLDWTGVLIATISDLCYW